MAEVEAPNLFSFGTDKLKFPSDPAMTLKEQKCLIVLRKSQFSNSLKTMMATPILLARRIFNHVLSDNSTLPVGRAVVYAERGVLQSTGLR
jgi:hypothetical protein